jgi:hypothetical protein
MVDLQLIGPSAICLFVFFDYHFLFFYFFFCSMWHRKCLVYTHTIRSINHAMATMKNEEKKRKTKKSDHSFFFSSLPKGHSIQSKKFKFLLLQSTNPFSSLFLFLVRCTCCMHTYTNKEKLSCHRLGIEKESNSLTEEASDGGKSEFHLH